MAAGAIDRGLPSPYGSAGDLGGSGLTLLAAAQLYGVCVHVHSARSVAHDVRLESSGDALAELHLVHYPEVHYVSTEALPLAAFHQRGGVTGVRPAATVDDAIAFCPLAC